MTDKKHELEEIMSVEEALKRALNIGSQGCLDRVEEFCCDVRQLVDAMEVLYKQDSAALLMLGVSVEVVVESKELGTLFTGRIGSFVKGDKID